MSKQKRPTQIPAPGRVSLTSKPPVLERIEPHYVHPRNPWWDRVRMIFIVGFIAVAGQLFAPEKYKPFSLAGRAVADFHGELFDEVNRKELELAQQHAIAQKMAELQADYATWTGVCSAVGALNPEAGAVCGSTADAAYRNALRQIRESELLYRRSQ